MYEKIAQFCLISQMWIVTDLVHASFPDWALIFSLIISKFYFLKVWTLSSLFVTNISLDLFNMIFDADGQLDSIAPSARSNPTVRRRRNHVELFFYDKRDDGVHSFDGL